MVPLETNHLSNPKLCKILDLRSFCLIVLSLLVFPFSALAQSSDVQPTKKEIQKFMRKTENRYVKKGKVQKAIEIYQNYVQTYMYVGRIHLRLGQLFEGLAKDANGDFQAQNRYQTLSVWHFNQCTLDTQLDRELIQLICEPKVKQYLKPFLFEGPNFNPHLIQPELFAGPLLSGTPLPIGKLIVEVQADEQSPVQRFEINHPQNKPFVFFQQTTPPPTNTAFPPSSASQPPLFNNSPSTQRSFFDRSAVPPPPAPKVQRSKIPGVVMIAGGIALSGLGIYCASSLTACGTISESFNEQVLPAFLIPSGLLLAGGTGWVIWAW